MTYRELLKTAVKKLKMNGIADADIDAWYLLAHVMRMDRTQYIMKQEEPVQEELAAEYQRLIDARASHIPLQHLTGVQEFMGMEFLVNGDVLIPRQDTECLVEEVLKVSEGKEILDLCTGSGCIIISLVKLGRIKSGTGADLSDKALAVARENSDRLQTEITWIQSDLYHEVSGQYDIIVSNPPYIREQEIPELMPEVKDHEPMMALLAKEEGLEFYRRIVLGAAAFLRRGGYIFFEIGCSQGMEVAGILQEFGFEQIQIKKDLSGLDRIVWGRLPE